MLFRGLKWIMQLKTGSCVKTAKQALLREAYDEGGSVLKWSIYKRSRTFGSHSCTCMHMHKACLQRIFSQ